MKTSIKVLLAAVVIGLGMSAESEAASASMRGAKSASAVNYTTTISAIATGPVALYGIVMSSVTTAGDYAVIWDSGSTTGLSIGTTTNLRAKIVGPSTTFPGQVVTFDPPIQLNHGLAVGLSAATNAATFIYERGRVTY